MPIKGSVWERRALVDPADGFFLKGGVLKGMEILFTFFGKNTLDENLVDVFGNTLDEKFC